MQSNQLISLGRINRIVNTKCLLGQPDIISIKQIKSASSLFNRDKKIEDIQENYINGLIFPTTAHFSSFISSRYKAKDPSKHTVKAKLFMFDAYGEKDIQIQISIPGSLEVKAYSLKGQSLPFNAADYERAYFSSFLRSLYPMNFPGIILYHLINRVEILRPIIKNFMSFSQKHELRELNNQFQMFRRSQFQENETRHNLPLQILTKYLLENGFGNLLKIVLEDLKKTKSQKFYQLEMEWKLKQKRYREILYKTSEKLLTNPHIYELKQFQIKALYKVGKYAQIAVIGRNLIESGGTSDQISSMILRSLIEIGEDKKYLKTLNLLLNLRNPQEKKILQVSHIHQNNSIISFGDEMQNIRCISEHTQLCFPFDNAFLNRTAEFLNKRDILQKNTKEGFTFNILQRVEESLNNNPMYYDTIVYYVKQKGWSTLVKNRANCFWLESDFASQSQSLRSSHNQSRFDDNFSFFQQNFDQSLEMQEKEFQITESQQKQKEETYQAQKKVQQEENNDQDFEGNLSQHQFPKQMVAPPKCSSRMQTINTARKFNPQQRKIQCCTLMEQLFFSLFNDLKLQNSLQSWEDKLKQAESSSFSPIKKQIAAIIYLKKGFLNRKLLQNKKCEQSFRNARKLSDSFYVNLVATFQLILLFIQNKNVKGVQFYLVELVKILKTMGIQTFDIVPEWAKPILQFVVQNQGLSIVKNIHPLFKCVFGFYLRSNLSQQEVNQILKLKK